LTEYLQGFNDTARFADGNRFPGKNHGKYGYYRTRAPQDGRIEVKMQDEYDLRVSTFPTIYGEKSS